jgi:hypothetical protein
MPPPTPSSSATPLLAPPGAGVPWIERLAGRLAAAALPHMWSWESVPDRFEAQSRKLLALLPPANDPRMLQRVLVRRVAGLEDSSRFWSPAMVLEHLVIIHGRMIPLIVSLSHERVPTGQTRTADLKPTGAWTARQALDAYHQSIADFRRAMLHDIGNRNAKARYPHPWFGPLNCRQWLCFAPFHQDIHLRQMRLIAKKLA